MQKLVRAIALISLLIWSSAITELADDPSSDPTRPLPLRERAVVIFEHSFQLKPVNVADVTVTSPTPGTPPKPKTLSNQVILKFILLATHNTDSEKVESRLVIFQNLNPDPKNSSGNTNKWFWSQFNQNLAKKELSLFDHKLGIQEIPEMEEPLLFSFPVGSRPADIRPAAIPPAPVANQIFYSLLLTHPNIATTPATSSPASLAKETEEIQVTPGTHVEETPAEKTFLDALGDRLQSIPDAVTDDPTPPSAQQIFSFQSHVLPRSRTDIAQNNDEVTVSFPMDLSKAPFNSEASPFQYLADRKTIILRTPPGLKDFYKQHEKLSLYGYMADWITASYTANNSTPEAQAGKEVFASTPVNVLIFNVGKKRRFDFYPTYFTGTLKQATVNHDFAVVPKGASLDIDYLTFFPYIWSFLDPEIRGSPAAPPETSAPVIPVAATDALTASDKSPLPEKKPLYTFPLPGLPTFNYDASGASAGIDLNLTPGDPTNKDLPSLEVSGGKYFDYDFYNVNTNLSWKFTPFVDPVATSADELAFDPKDIGGSGRTTTDQLSSWKGSFGPQFARSVTPNGESSASKTSGMAAFSIEKDVADDSYKWTQTAGISANSNYATGVSTDEYSGTTYAQQLWREHIPWFFGGSPGDYDKEEKTPPANVVTMQIDLNEWTKPAEATQNSNFYTSAASRLHVGADFPVPPCGNDTAEFIRADTFLTGGGVMGVAPDTDRFYGGNTGGQGDAGSDLPGPVVRSFGTGKLGIFPTSTTAKQKPVGALSFANLDLTLAFPIPGLAKPFLDPEEAGKLNHILDPVSSDPSVRELDGGMANWDEINFVANYDYWFSAKPLFTIDAAWLGGPVGYRDRSLISVGGGAEFSMAVLNLDVLYEVTLHDTSVRQQPLGENIIVQLTYDIHF